MRILIVGAGAVGSHLAERLSVEGQDVVVVESDPTIASNLQAEVDCLVVTGNGTSPAVLEEAGIKQADLLIAVTSSDAVNVLACHAGARLGVPVKVARIEDPALRTETELLGVDYVIDPVAALSRELLTLVRQGGVSELREFADGRLLLLGGFIHDDAPVVGLTLAALRQKVTGWEWLVAALIRDGETIVARGDTKILQDDHVLLMTKKERVREVTSFLGLEERRVHKVIVMGGTRLAQLTADLLVGRHITTVVVDNDSERCRNLAELDDRLVVICGDPTDPKLLTSEGLQNADAALALSGWDEINILGCLVAKAIGVKRTVARLHRLDLVGLLPGAGIDSGVSSRLAAANEILRLVRRGHVHSVVTFQDTTAEAIEIEVGDDSPAIGKNLTQIHLPHSAIVSGVVRGSDAFVPRGRTVVEAHDRLIVFALPDAINTVEEMFAGT